MKPVHSTLLFTCLIPMMLSGCSGGSSDSDDRLRDLGELGDRSGFLEKPFTRSSLLATLATALGDRWESGGGGAH